MGSLVRDTVHSPQMTVMMVNIVLAQAKELYNALMSDADELPPLKRLITAAA